MPEIPEFHIQSTYTTPQLYRDLRHGSRVLALHPDGTWHATFYGLHAWANAYPCTPDQVPSQDDLANPKYYEQLQRKRDGEMLGWPHSAWAPPPGQHAVAQQQRKARAPKPPRPPRAPRPPKPPRPPRITRLQTYPCQMHTNISTGAFAALEAAARAQGCSLRKMACQVMEAWAAAQSDQLSNAATQPPGQPEGQPQEAHGEPETPERDRPTDQPHLGDQADACLPCRA